MTERETVHKHTSRGQEEREREREREREKARERIPSRLCAVSTELNVGPIPQAVRSGPEPKARTRGSTD